MRPLDVLLAVPSLLLVLLVAAVYSPGTLGLVLLVALVNIPDAARMVRASAAEAASRPAVEALRMQGESWWRIAVGYVGRATRRTLVADAGVRLTGVLYLVATTAFLGVGVAPDAADWAVMVDRNRHRPLPPAVGGGGARAADRGPVDGYQPAPRRRPRAPARPPGPPPPTGPAPPGPPARRRPGRRPPRNPPALRAPHPRRGEAPVNADVRAVAEVRDLQRPVASVHGAGTGLPGAA